MLQLSESLFADKIKVFKPVSDEYEPGLDDAQDDVEDNFDFTEIGSNNDKEEASNLTADGTLRRDMT